MNIAELMNETPTVEEFAQYLQFYPRVVKYEAPFIVVASALYQYFLLDPTVTDFQAAEITPKYYEHTTGLIDWSFEMREVMIAVIRIQAYRNPAFTILEAWSHDPGKDATTQQILYCLTPRLIIHNFLYYHATVDPWGEVPVFSVIPSEPKPINTNIWNIVIKTLNRRGAPERPAKQWVRAELQKGRSREAVRAEFLEKSKDVLENNFDKALASKRFENYFYSIQKEKKEKAKRTD